MQPIKTAVYIVKHLHGLYLQRVLKMLKWSQHLIAFCLMLNNGCTAKCKLVIIAAVHYVKEQQVTGVIQ